MANIEHWTEDDAEVIAAAKALAAYYDGTDEDAETWVAGATVALNATNLRGAVDRIAELERENRALADAAEIYAVAIEAMGIELPSRQRGGQ